MEFMDSYKRLEKLCGDALNTDRPVKAYIEEMKKIPQGARYVSGWDNDLDRLKHYLWVRNKIAHEPGCTEENMCDPEDAQWLDDFYFRIMKQTDPLALYRKATQSHTASVPRKPATQPYSYPVQPKPVHNPVPKSEAGCLTWLVAILVMVLLIGCLLFL